MMHVAQELPDLTIPKFLRRKVDAKPAPVAETQEEQARGLLVDPDKLRWIRVYWGTTRVEGPCLGWSTCFLIPGAKGSTAFCPYTMNSWALRNEAEELKTCIDMGDQFRHDFIVKLLLENWAMYQRLRLDPDLEVAAIVLNRLGEEAPVIVIDKDGQADNRSRGGKPAADTMLKPLKRDSKRGKFLAYMIDGNGSIRSAMAEFGMSRNSVLSMLFNLNRGHGVGYSLVGDLSPRRIAERLGMSKLRVTKVEKEQVGVILETLKEEGYNDPQARFEPGGKHLIVRVGGLRISICRSPSDHRGLRNLRSQVRRLARTAPRH